MAGDSVAAIGSGNARRSSGTSFGGFNNTSNHQVRDPKKFDIGNFLNGSKHVPTQGITAFACIG